MLKIAQTNPATAPRSSATISAEIDRLNEDLTRGNARLKVLSANYDAAILAGDKEAEANESETTLTRRTVRRAELRLTALKFDLEQAKEREREAAAQIQRDQATSAVAAVMKKFDTGYREPARAIAAFLREYQAANDLAFEAGVPRCHNLTRFRAGEVEPEHTREAFVYIDEQGNETDNEFPPGSYRLDAEGRKLDNMGHVLKPRPKRQKLILVPRRRTPDMQLPSLCREVNLPALTLDDQPIYPPATPT
jgi:hypothetical protein